MVSIPERKLDSASSCGGLGVVDLEGMGVMDLENPFSLGSFDSAGKGDSSRLIHGRSWTRKEEGDRRARHRRQGVPAEISTYFLTRRVCLTSWDGDDRRVW